MKIEIIDYLSKKHVFIEDFSKSVLFKDFSFTFEQQESGILCKSNQPFFFDYYKIDLNRPRFEFTLAANKPVSILSTAMDNMSKYTFKLID